MRREALDDHEGSIGIGGRLITNFADDLVVLRLNVPVNNFSVMSGRIFADDIVVNAEEGE